MNAKFSIRRTALAALVNLVSTSGAAFFDEPSAGVTVLRATATHLQQPQKSQQV
jgi:hypothetical protein